MPREHGDRGEFVETIDLEDVLGVIDEVRGPVVLSADVADALDCTPETARKKLAELHDRGDLERRKVARRVVYWRPEDHADRGDAVDDQEPVTETTAPPEPGADASAAREAPRDDGRDETTDPSAETDDVHTAASSGAPRDEQEREVWDVLEELDITGRGHETRQVRREAIMDAWRELRRRGTAETQEIAVPAFDAHADRDRFGYSANDDPSLHRAYNFWDGCAREVMKALPYVEPPPERGNTWRYTGD